MYKAAVNFLRGQVLVHIESGCPERVVNLCAGAEVPFWDVRWLSPVELTLRTTRRGLAQVRRAAEQVGAAATVRREQGAPLLARRLRRRYVLLTAQVPLTVRQRGVPLSSRTRYALDIGKKRIKLYGKGSTLGGDCDKITQYRPVCLPWGLRLPITVAAETVTAYGPSTDVPRSTREARDEGESLLRRQLEELLGDTGTAENVRIDAVEQGSWLLVTLRAECLEEIGREVPLTDD